MNITEIKCKTALSESRLPGLDYSLNPYRGCQHSCSYCYVPNILRIKRDEWGNFVNVKTNIPVILSKELKKKKPGVIALSTVTDPYQPIEKKYKITRYCLEQIIKSDFPVHVQTKSDLVKRDIDLISKLKNCEIMFSIATLNDSERKILEPNASSIQDRLNAMKLFSENNIKTTVFLGPIYPNILKKDIPEFVHTLVEFGAKEIMVDKFNLKPGIFQNLKKTKIPNLKKIQDPTDYTNIFNEIKIVGEKCKIKVCSAF